MRGLRVLRRVGVAVVTASMSMPGGVAYAAVELDPSPAPAATPVSERSLPRWRGNWDTVAELPYEPRTDAAVAVNPGAPHGIVLWGGVASDGRLLNDGILIDSDQPARPRVMPASLLSARRDFGWASDRDHVYVWGGLDEAGAPLDDGAQYAATWTLMPESPLPPGPASMVVVDNRLWVVATDPDTHSAKIASISVPLDERSHWSDPVDVPLPEGVRYDIVGCCDRWWGDAETLSILSLRSDGFADAVAWDIGSVSFTIGTGSEWIQLGRVPVPPLPAAGPAVGYAVEQGLAAWVGSSDEAWLGTGATGAFGVLLSPDRPSDGWSLTRPAPEGVGSDPALVLSPRHLVSVQAMVAYDLATNRWLSLPPRHRSARFGPPTGATAWWDKGKLWVFGGRTPDGSMESHLWTFEPKLPKGTYPLAIGDLRLYVNGGQCRLVGRRGTWRLRGDPLDQDRVWMQRGPRRIHLRWPDGWHARFDPELAIIDTTGTVRYREGDECDGVMGTGG